MINGSDNIVGSKQNQNISQKNQHNDNHDSQKGSPQKLVNDKMDCVDESGQGNSQQFNQIAVLQIICIVYIIQDLFTQQELFEYSGELTLQIQSEFSEQSIQILAIISTASVILLSILVFGSFVFFNDQLVSIIYSLYFLFILFLHIFLQMIYSQQRPYMDEKQIVPYDCERDFGNPSGHCVMIMFGLLGFYQSWKENQKVSNNLSRLHLGSSSKLDDNFNIMGKGFSQEVDLTPSSEFQDKEAGQKNSDSLSSPKKQTLNSSLMILKEQRSPQITPMNSDHFELSDDRITLQNIACLFLIWLSIIVVGFSRLAMGMHSLNQIILGYVIGIGFSAAFFEILLIKTQQTIINLAKGNDLQTAPSKQNLLIKTIIVYILVIMIVILVFQLKSKLFTTPVQWIQQVKLCLESDIQKSMFFEQGLQDSAILSIFFGVIIAIFLSQGEIQAENCSKWSDAFEKLPLKQQIIRFLIFIGVPALVVAPSLLYLEIKNPSSIYLRFFIRCVAFFLGTFLMLYLVPIIYYNYQIDIPGDFLRKKNSLIQTGELQMNSQSIINDSIELTNRNSKLL